MINIKGLIENPELDENNDEEQIEKEIIINQDFNQDMSNIENNVNLNRNIPVNSNQNQQTLLNNQILNLTKNKANEEEEREKINILIGNDQINKAPPNLKNLMKEQGSFYKLSNNLKILIFIFQKELKMNL